MSGGIADLFRVQKAAEMSQNPMAPEIGRSTSLPPQLLDLVKQATMTEQAQMRMQAQTQQTPQQMPTVADTVRQKSAAIMQQQHAQQQDQQQLLQRLTQAQQGVQRFAEGGAVEMFNQLPAGTYMPKPEDAAKDEEKPLPALLRLLMEQLPANSAARRKFGAQVGATGEDPAENARELQRLMQRGRKDTPTSRAAATEPKREAPPAEAAAAGAPALRAVLDRVSQSGQPRQAPAPQQAAPEQQPPAQQAPAGAGGQASPFTALAEKLASEKGEDPDAAIKRIMELRKQFGPQGAEADFIKQQLAQRDAQIAAAGKEKPGITQIVTAMARAARNDPKGGWGAGLLGAAEFTQAQKEARKAKVQELQAAKDALLQKMAALQDAKQSGDLQAVVAADADARKAAQDFQAKRMQMVTQFGTQEMSGQQADRRTDKEISARATEGAADRRSRESIAAGSNAATMAAARMRADGEGGSNTKAMRAMTAVQQVLNNNPEYKELAKMVGMAPNSSQGQQAAARMRQIEAQIIGRFAPELLESPGAPKPAAPGASGGWGTAEKVK